MAAANKEAAFSPSLTGNSGAGSNTSNGANYQNVAQKGKLILPTAFWILIVVGGICFLGLLSSLNKTMSTLDTLVEIEQANAILNKNDRLLHRHRHYHSESSKAEPNIAKLDGVSDDDKTTLHSEEKDWFSFPNWASLERKPTERFGSKARSITHKSMDESLAHKPAPSSASDNDDESLNSIIEKVVRSSSAMNQLNGEPIEGKITVIGIGGGNGNPPLNDAFKESKMVSSMMNDLLMGGGNAGLFANQGVYQPIKPIRIEDVNPKQEPATGGIAVTANIDKINININNVPAVANNDERATDDEDHDDDDDDDNEDEDEDNDHHHRNHHTMIEKLDKKARTKKLPKDHQENEISQSIDSLIASLVDQSHGHTHGGLNHEHQPFGHQQQQPGNSFQVIPLQPPVAPYLMHLANPLDKHPALGHNNDEHANNKPPFHHEMLRPDRFHPRHRPILPLSELLMPFEPMPQPHSPMDNSIPPMFGRPMSRLVIALGGDDGATTDKPTAPPPLTNAVVATDDNNLKPPMELLNNLLSTTIKPLAALSPSSTQLPSTQLPTILDQQINSPLDFSIGHKAPRFKLDENLMKESHHPIFAGFPTNHHGDDDGHSQLIMTSANQPSSSSLSGLIEAMQNTPHEGLGNPQKNDGVESVVFINGEPLISDHQLSQSSMPDEREQVGGKLSGKIPHNQVNDLFQLFFGPPPDSKLVVAPQISPPSKFDIITSNESKKEEKHNDDERKEKIKNEDALFGELKSKHKQEKHLQPAVEEPLISKMIITPISSGSPSSSKDDGLKDSGDFDPLVDNLLGAMFALPQMSSGQDPIKVDSEPNVVKDIIEPFAIPSGPEYIIEQPFDK